MTDFNIRSDSVNVEQIMQQIRARIREKRGVDYTEEQIRELAAVKLERFLDPQKVRSGLLDQFRQGTSASLPNYAFEDTTLYESHRAVLRWIRKLLNPVLKLFFNPNKIVHALHLQADLNQHHAEHEAQVASLTYELLHNLVLETTRLGIEVKNLTMRVESVSSRFDFAERRARALEGMVQYRPEDKAVEAPSRGRAGQGQASAGQASRPGQASRSAQSSRPAQPSRPAPTAQQAEQAQQAQAAPSGPSATAPAAGRDGDPSATSEARRRRRRRRGRRGGTTPAPTPSEPVAQQDPQRSTQPDPERGPLPDPQREPQQDPQRDAPHDPPRDPQHGDQ